MATILEVTEGAQYQTSDEQLAYKIDVSNWATPSSVTQVKAYDESVDAEVTTTVFPTNNPSVSGNNILLSLLKALTKNHSYRVEILWVDTSGNTWETLAFFKCFR